MEYLFVYGTLQTKFTNKYARLLHSSATIIGEAYFYGKLFLIDYYPGAIAEWNEQSKVYGTLFKLNESHQLLQVLDEYEEVGEAHEHPNEYIREKLFVYDLKGVQFHCWVYLYNRDTTKLQIITSGRFADY